MTSVAGDLSDVHPARQRLSLALAVLATLPGIVVRLTHPELSQVTQAVLFGIAIVGAAFMLAWAAEVAQLDVSAGLAIAALAFIAVLPEYAVDMVFAWKAGHAVAEFGSACRAPDAVVESPCSLALANMTGANRLLIGIGWSMVIFIAWWRHRQRRIPFHAVALERSQSVELSYLAVATMYSLTLPMKSTVTLLDALVLVGIFVAYTIRLSSAPAAEPHLIGPARYIGTFGPRARRTAVAVLFVFAAAVILLVAEHFAEALVATGREIGISEFVLVQWLAPLASEAPELLVAGLYAWRLNTSAGLGTLVSSKVNQWTLLVGTLPVVFALASGSFDGLPVEPRQREELLLTSAQSVFAVAILLSLSISLVEALLLFGLFWGQFLLGAMVPEDWHGAERIGVSVVYLVLAVLIGLRERAAIPRLLRDGFRTPHSELAG
ncbi:MAG: sodium:proton exchanger [bacterium]|nr:sodium:proton exchanger [bacterium]